MKTKTYYHGTKENNLKEIIQARKLIQGNKNYSQSEDGYVYLFDEEYFGWAIAYAHDCGQKSYNFIKIQIYEDSDLDQKMILDKKEIKTFLGKYNMKQYLYKGDIEFSNESINSVEYIILKDNNDYELFSELVGEGKYKDAQVFINKLKWIII